MTITLRLDDQLLRRLAAVAKAKGISKSELIRRCLAEYLGSDQQQLTAWELGKHSFGCYKSGQGDLAARAKDIAGERIHASRAERSGR